MKLGRLNLLMVLGWFLIGLLVWAIAPPAASADDIVTGVVDGEAVNLTIMEAPGISITSGTIGDDAINTITVHDPEVGFRVRYPVLMDAGLLLPEDVGNPLQSGDLEDLTTSDPVPRR